MKKIKDGIRKKRERARVRSTEIEARSLGEKSGPHEVAEVAEAEDSERPLTSDKSQRLDYATLGDRQPVDEAENEVSQSRASVRESSPDGAMPDARPERVHQQLPDLL